METEQSPNYRGRGKSTKAKKDAYIKYYETKKAAAELEARNNHHLVLYPASDFKPGEKTFYVMGGNSAIIYVHDIAPRIGRKKAALKIDTDKSGVRFQTGVCMISDLEKLEQLLAEQKIKRLKDYKELKIFKLAREYRKEEIRAMLRVEQEKTDLLNKLAYANVLYPDIHQQIIELQKAIPPKVNKMSNTYRELFGNHLVKNLLTITETYAKMTHNLLAEEDGMETMSLCLIEIIADLSIYNEIKLWDVNDCTRIGTIAAKAETLIREKLSKKRH